MARLLITALFTFAVLWVVSDANSVNTEHYQSSVSRQHKRDAEETEVRAVCESEECQDLARLLKESMNETADPCENFYLYACGNWMEHNPLPEGYSAWNMLVRLQQYVQNETSGILNEENKPDDLLPLKMARKLYKSCMDLEDMERRGLEPLVLTIARGGGMPMILEDDEYDENHLTWQRVDDYYIYLTGELTFIDISIRPSDDEVDSIYLPYLALPPMPVGSFLLTDGEPKSKSEQQSSSAPDTQGSKEQPDGHEEKSALTVEGVANKRVQREANSTKKLSPAEKRQKYHDFVTRVAVAISKARGFEASAESMSEDVDDLIDFIIELESLRGFPTSETNMTLREFQEWYDGLGYTSKTAQIDWVHKLTMLFHNANAELDENSLVRVLEMTYIEKLAELLNKTAPRTVVNYVHWRIGSHSLNATTQEMRNLVENLGNTNSQLTSERENDGNGENAEEELRKQRQIYCSEQMEMSSTVDFEYVKRHFDQDTIDAVKQMVENIREEIIKQIEHSEWMDENTKTYALSKVKAMDSVIGYPKWYENETMVNSFYKGLIISPSYYENVIMNAKRKNWKKLSLVMKSVMEVMVNYGMLGLIIGHEINHAFDSDNFGDKIPGMDTPNILTDAYGTRAGCFVEQYNSYVIELGWYSGRTAYGNQTSGENIADAMGLIAGYYAYKKQEADKGRPEPTLPGFETFTNNQLFFLSYANVWCEHIDADEIEKQSRSDVHSPGFMRVIGTLSNSEAFADAFNCPNDSPMNPERKCNIWT